MSMATKAATATQKDLLVAIYEQVQAVSDDVSALKLDMTSVKEQVKYTNGKVAGLIEDKIRRDERQKVIAESAAQTVAPVISTQEGNVVVQPPASYWSSKEKLYGALAGLAAVLATAISIYFGVTK